MSRVLVVDDEESLVTAIAYNLRRDGHEVETVADGERALEVAQATQHDLVVLDPNGQVIEGDCTPTTAPLCVPTSTCASWSLKLPRALELVNAHAAELALQPGDALPRRM